MQVITPINDADEAVALTDDSRYGPAGQIWTTSLEVGDRGARVVRTRITWVNCFFVIQFAS